MELIKITALSEQLGISSRSLRYYEEVGLIQSVRPEFEKYRYFDRANIERLQQIMVLRKMQIPIKDILRIYESEDMSAVVEAFVDRLNAIDNEVNALTELRSIVNDFLQTMIKNGIEKISALPLLYEEIAKQLQQDKESKPMTYRELSEISARASKPVEIRLTELQPMRVLSSFMKDSQKLTSSVDEFWKWLHEQDLPLGTPGGHTSFEFQNPQNNLETVMMVRIPDDFANSSPFEDFSFDGGLFAVTSAYVDEDIRASFEQLITAFDTNKYYEIDYLHSGRLRHEALIETVISPDEQRERIELFVPVKKRVADASHFTQSDMVDHITVEEIEQANPVIQSFDIPLQEITPILDPVYKINAQGEAEYQSWIDKRVLSTNIELKIPFRVDITFKTSEASLRLYHGKSSVMLNVGNVFDLGDTSTSLLVRDPVFGNEQVYDHKGQIRRDEYNQLTWIAGEKIFAVILNGEVRHCGIHYPYMQLELGLLPAYPVIIGSNSAEVLTLKSVRVSKVLQHKKMKIKQGMLTAINKPSNNMLPELHNLVTWHYGQNYTFNGCMAFLMECLGENKEDFDYAFFGGISGDNFTQVYGHHYEMFCNCVSAVADKPAFIQRIFDACGYGYSYIESAQINANKEQYLETLMSYIDRGIPVISKEVHDIGQYRLYCGYEEGGKTLLYLEGDAAEPLKLDMSHGITQDWILAGGKLREIDLAAVYREAVLRIPELLTMSETNRCTFGPQAFRDWAEDLERGRYDGLTPENFDQWRDYTIYVCNFATNSVCSHSFLEKAQQLNPDMTFIQDIRDLYTQTGTLWKEIEDIGGGFNVTLEILQDPEKCQAIAEKLRGFAACYDEILGVFTRSGESYL